MNIKAMLENAANNTEKLTPEEEKALKSRGAVSAVPLTKGDIIAFGSDASKLTDVRTIGGNKIVMLIGGKLAKAGDKVTDATEGVQVSSVAFGRAVTNRNTGVAVTPATVAAASGETYDAAKLAYNQLQNMSLADVPNYVAGKTFRIVGLQDVGLTLPDGTPRVNTQTGQQMFQTVYAFEEV